MRRIKQVLAAAVAAGATVMTVGVGTASAGSTYDPNVTRIANPANVCKSIPGSIEYANALLGINAQLTGFHYSDCVRTMAQGKAFVQPADLFGNPYEQCRKLISGSAPEGTITLPFVFHDGTDPEDQLLPDLKANNIKECGNALYAFHAIFDVLGPALGG